MSEQVAKGRTLADGTYVYTCGHCDGKGYDGTDDCTWCYGGDTKRIAAELMTARGQRYYGLLKALLSVHGKAMRDEFMVFRHSADGATPVEIAYLALKYRLNFKATWEWLHETGCLQRDYDDVRRAFKVAEAFKAARRKYADIGEGQ